MGLAQKGRLEDCWATVVVVVTVVLPSLFWVECVSVRRAEWRLAVPGWGGKEGEQEEKEGKKEKKKKRAEEDEGPLAVSEGV